MGAFMNVLIFYFSFSLLILTFLVFYILQVEIQTISRQIDLITTHEGEEDLSMHTMPVYV